MESEIPSPDLSPAVSAHPKAAETLKSNPSAAKPTLTLREKPQPWGKASLAAFGLTLLAGLIILHFRQPLTAKMPPKLGQFLGLQTAPQEDVEQRIAALEAEIAALKARPATLAPTPDVAALVAEELRKQQAANPQADAVALQQNGQSLLNLQQQVSLLTQTLQGKIAELEKAPKANLELTLAFEQLQTAVLQNLPFDAQLQRAQMLASEDEYLRGSLHGLQPFAAKGKPTLADLRRQFSGGVKLWQSETDDKGNGMASSILRNLQKMLRIRKLDSEAKTSAGSVALAEKALEEGKVAQSMAALENLPAEEQAPFAPYRQQAEAYLTVGQLMDKVQLAFTRHLQPQAKAEDVTQDGAVSNAP